MKNKYTVSIGIPAYNEERNIRSLLTRLLGQKQNTYVLKEIIVVIDGATDNTEKIVRSFPDRRIKCVVNRERRGQQACQNDIIERFKGDILVFIEADTRPYNDHVLDELVVPFQRKNNVGMVVGQVVPLAPWNFYERILYHGTFLKWEIFNHWKSGSNLYMSGGHGMKALARHIAKKLLWPNDVPEDSYTYLKLKQMGVRILKNPKAKAYMQNVHTFRDRIKQCRKFHGGRKKLERYFSKSVVSSEYEVSKFLIGKIVMKEMLRNPFWTIMYLGEAFVNRIFSMSAKQFSALHPIYESSKSLYAAKEKIIYRNPSITIGIPAYNEEQNITYLVRMLLKQRITQGELKRILVISDGSTDRTTAVLRKIRSDKLQFTTKRKRIGISRTQNEIVNRSKTDILILLDADVLPADTGFVDKIIEPLLKDHTVGLVGGHVSNVDPQTRIEKILSYGQEFKRIMFQSIYKGDNIYLCHGRARAFRKELYEKISWPHNVPEDAYSYLQCLKQGFRFIYVHNAVALFRLPATIHDYIKQTKRFEAGKKMLYQYFPKDTVISTYRIPLQSLVYGLVTSFVKNPLYFVSYIALRFYVFHINKEKINHTAIYDLSITTKNLLKENILTQ